MAITILELLDYARKQLKPLPANRWTGSGDGKDLTISAHTVGLDISRGPWLKFEFTFDGDATKYEVQGYKTWSKGDRIKFGPKGKMKECDDDHLDFRAAVDLDAMAGDVIVKFSFIQEDTVHHSLRFVGKVATP